MLSGIRLFPLFIKTPQSLLLLYHLILHPNSKAHSGIAPDQHTFRKMKLNSLLHNIAVAASIFLSVTVTSGCDSLIYDQQGDCDPYYKVKFKYDYNLKFSDAFAAEVTEVTLYVVDDATGKVVWQKHEAGPELASGSYMMDVDVDPGTYTLIAWCGSGHTSSFGVADAEFHSDLKCRLQDRQEPSGFLANGKSHVRNRLNHLYHAKLDAQVFPKEQGTHVFEMHLTKDTNTVNIVLQNLSGDEIAPDDFTYTIVEDNGHMAHDNSLIPDEELTYFPWQIRSGVAEYDPVTRGAERMTKAQTSIAITSATLTTGRLMADRKSYVKIYNKDQSLVASLPLIDYAKMTKNYYEKDGRELTDQEFLDYQDEYEMMLFMDQNGRWMNSYIYINNWKIVLQNTDL